MQMPNATLIAPKRVTLEQLDLTPTPEAIGRHKPIPHGLLIRKLTAEAHERSLTITETQLGLSANGMRLFGIMSFKPNYDDAQTGFAMGFHSSHDKSLSFRCVAGAKVFVCSNLCMRGDTDVISRLHTSGMDLEDVIHTGFEQFLSDAHALQNQIHRWQQHLLEDNQVEHIIYDAFTRKEAILPAKCLSTVHHAYMGTHDPDDDTGMSFAEKYRSWGSQSLWRLNNAFTYAAKACDTIDPTKHSRMIGTYFNKIVK